jgi:4-carboxymuconolactone decarboxylase
MLEVVRASIMTTGDTVSEDLSAASAAADRARRHTLSEEYVDRATREMSPEDEVFQRYVTDVVWSNWSRPGLAPRDRSLITIAMSAALNQIPELELHVQGAIRNGVTHAELWEVIMQVVAYCGAPAGVQAKRGMIRALAALDSDPGSTAV